MGKESRKTLSELTKDINADLAVFQSSYIKELKAHTPVRTGAAKRSWKKVRQLRLGIKGIIIDNKVGYASILDEGYSKQAPSGMTKPAYRRSYKSRRR
jgi:hypothetical protein